MNPVRAAAVQMHADADVEANLREARRRLEAAARERARLAVLPENFAFMGAREQDKLGVAEAFGDGPMQAFLAASAAALEMVLVGGTIPIRTEHPDRVRAACLVYGPDGRLLGRYDKIHLFDVALPEGGERYCESDTIEPGDAPVLVDTEAGRLGLGVCYDVRFPELFRTLAARGMEILALPAAFTAATGRAHWAPLLRARAIENLCYVVAAAQVGYHSNGRRTYGHSMVIDPWGEVLAHCDAQPGVAVGAIDRDRLAGLRQTFPVLNHRRLESDGRPI